MSFDTTSYRQHLAEIRERLDRDNKALFFAVTDTVDEYYNRIFIEHKNTAGGTIAYKSKNQVYINPQNSPKSFKPEGSPFSSRKLNSFTKILTNKGKGSKTKTKILKTDTGTKKVKVALKTKWFDSYKDFKKLIGRPILELFGELQSSVSSGTKKLNDNSYVLSIAGKESKKIEGLQFGNGKWTGFGVIFKLSTEEKKLFFDTYRKNATIDLR